MVLEMGPSVIYCSGKYRKKKLCVYLKGGVVKAYSVNVLCLRIKNVVLRVCICLCASAFGEGGWMS